MSIRVVHKKLETDKKYSNILKSWDKNWSELTVFFEYPAEIGGNNNPNEDEKFLFCSSLRKINNLTFKNPLSVKFR